MQWRQVFADFESLDRLLLVDDARALLSVSNDGGALRLWSAADGLLIWEAPASSASAATFHEQGIDYSDADAASAAAWAACHTLMRAIDAAPSSAARLSGGERDLSVPLRTAAAHARKRLCQGCAFIHIRRR